MADPEEDTPEYWNQLVLEIFDELKDEADWMMDTLTRGGILPGEPKVTLQMLQRMEPPRALATIGRMMQTPHQQRDGVDLLAKYLTAVQNAKEEAAAALTA